MRAALFLTAASFPLLFCVPAASAQQAPGDEILVLEQRLQEATTRQDAEEAKAEAPAKAAYVKELERVRDAVKAKGQLDALIEVEGTLKAVQDDTDHPKAKILAAALATAQSNYDKAREFSLRSLALNRARFNAEYDRAIGDLEVKYTRAGNVEAAKRAREARRILLTVDAFVDGPSTLNIRKDGLSWVNGGNGKPGPAYVDGRKWDARWTKPDQTRGPDKSDQYRIALPSLDLKVDLVAVVERRGQEGIDKRTPIDIKVTPSEIRIVIPDPEAGQRWYKFVFRLK